MTIVHSEIYKGVTITILDGEGKISWSAFVKGLRYGKDTVFDKSIQLKDMVKARLDDAKFNLDYILETV